MKRAYAFLSIISLIAVACSSDGEASGRPTASALDDGKLVACTDMPYEPFEFTDHGENAGIDIDLIRAIGEDWDVEVEFRDTDFDSIFDEMVKGTCDLVASAVSITDDRRQNYLFSDGYFEVNQSLAVRKDDASSIVGLDSLTGKKVGVQKGTTGADYATERATSSTIVSFDDASEMISALERRDIDGVIQDFPINSYLAQNSKTIEVVTTFTDVAREQYGFAMAKDAVELRDALNKALEKVRRDGRYDDILHKYLGSAV